MGNYASDVAQEAVLTGADICVQGGEEQDVPSRSATMDGSLTGDPLEHKGRAVGSTSRRSLEQAELPNCSALLADNAPDPFPYENADYKK